LDMLRPKPSVWYVAQGLMVHILWPQRSRSSGYIPALSDPGDLLSVNTPSSSVLHDGATAGGSPRRVTETKATETKAAFKTTEFVVYLIAVLGVLIASNLVGEVDGRGDVFLADKAWLYVTLLTIGYLLSRRRRPV
jgi:hypothetical protein